MPVDPKQIVENERRIAILEILVERIVNYGSVDQDDLEAAKKQAAKQLSEKYDEVEFTG